MRGVPGARQHPDAQRIILALDLPTSKEALRLARTLTPPLSRVKVGPALFAIGGAALLRSLRKLGLGVFLDLKLHDIPNTVRGAVAALAELGAELLTVHLSGGAAMVRAAVAAAHEAGPTKILGVTVLSSLNGAGLRDIGFAEGPLQSVERLARLGAAEGVDGVVCSPREAAAVRRILPPPRLVVTPGIRRAGDAADDQARTATAAEALAAGADLLVVGRPVIGAPEPRAALEALLREIGS